MALNSVSFFLFFLVVWGAYWLLPHRKQNALLLAASYLFYCFFDYRFLALILVSTTVDFWVARRMAGTEIEEKRRRYLLASLLVNLGILGFFKYFNFFLESAAGVLDLAGIGARPWHLNILLPIGISFYTFKTLSYTIGVYGRELPPTRRWIDYAAYVAFFPQLLSGPIDRASALIPQIENPRTFSSALIRTGVWLFIWGLFKKAAVADNLADLANPAFSADLVVSASYAWAGLYAYALQLYCDFSGYTDMARGVATLLGFHTAINFRNPFFATNPNDFWQRWHISLSSWIQDYVYFPLAAFALRKSMSAWSQYWPHVFTMVLIGLWHQARLTNIAFGFYWGVALVLYNVVRSRRKKKRHRSNQPANARPALPSRTGRFIAMAALFHAVCFSFVLFRSPTMGDALRFFGVLLGFQAGVAGAGGWAALNAYLAMAILYFPVLAVQIHQERRGNLLSPLSLSLLPRMALYAAIAIMLLTLGKTGGGAFIYIQF